MSVKPIRLWRKLRKAGGTPVKGGGSGHRVIKYNGRRAQVPFHGGSYEISDRLVDKILADLGLTRGDLGL